MHCRDMSVSGKRGKKNTGKVGGAKPKVAQSGKLTLANLQAHTRATTDHADEDTQTAGISNLQDVFARVQRFANSHLETHREVRAVLHLQNTAMP